MTYRKTVALVGAALLLTAGTLTVEDEFIAACEVTLKERLKSPSSYVRKDTSKMLIEPATLDEYLGEEDPEIKQTNEEHANDNKLVAAIRSEQVKRFNREDHYKFTILIRYEAKNAFGVSLADVASCRAFVTDPEGFDVGQMTGVIVDGYSSIEWMLRR